jgi:hypothetical protein
VAPRSCADCVCMVRKKRNFCRYREKSTIMKQYGPYLRWYELRWGNGSNAGALREVEFYIAEECKLFEPKGPR